MALHMAQAATALPAGWWTTWPTLVETHWTSRGAKPEYDITEAFVQARPTQIGRTCAGPAFVLKNGRRLGLKLALSLACPFLASHLQQRLLYRSVLWHGVWLSLRDLQGALLLAGGAPGSFADTWGAPSLCACRQTGACWHPRAAFLAAWAERGVGGQQVRVHSGCRAALPRPGRAARSC